jgi:hypothetical protein
LPALADDDRMAGGLAQADVEPDRAEIVGNQRCGFTTMRLVGGICGNRRNAQQGEQPLETLIEILIDMVEDGVKSSSHETFLCPVIDNS